MKKILKFIGILLLLIIGGAIVFYIMNNEALPEGESGAKADELAKKMTNVLHKEAFDNTEVIEWDFRGEHFYVWNKKEGTVIVSWDKHKVNLNLKNHELSTGGNKEIIEKALAYFNNDSFWLAAPYKVFDYGAERKLVHYKGKDALLVTYTKGGTTPGDSYLWILDDNGMPTSLKMWTQIIPIGGIEATWNTWIKTESEAKFATNHKINLFGLAVNLGNIKATTPKADALAKKILKTIKHKAYKKTRYIDWSFGGRRFYKWDKQEHIVEVKWDSLKVILHPNALNKSTAYNNDSLVTDNTKLIKRATDLFNNDSFWLVAPHKLFENGILRSIVEIEGKEALKVKYTSGGSTPGDSYTWILDKNYLPIKYLMNVPSMSMKAVPATWEEWIITDSGTLLPKLHSFANDRKLSMGEVKGYN